ncbi:Macrocin O-methyltransferase [Obelidium mucronatum]|nr:Macrocin O-methyltransferase [Obelidium mucronatum]
MTSNNNRLPLILLLILLPISLFVLLSGSISRSATPQHNHGNTQSASTSQGTHQHIDRKYGPMEMTVQDRKWITETAQTPNLPTMVSNTRLRLTLDLARWVLVNNVEGDFVETGTNAGGSTILLMKALERYDYGGSRLCFGADSFEGLPPPVNADKTGDLKVGSANEMKVGYDLFMDNMEKFKVNTKRLRVLKGWFSDTLPKAPITKISFLRLDGDLYTSTMDALVAVYDKVSIGGVIYADDYGSFNGCKKAIDEFRELHGITAPLLTQYNIDPANLYESVYWIKEE